MLYILSMSHGLNRKEPINVDQHFNTCRNSQNTHRDTHSVLMAKKILFNSRMIKIGRLELNIQLSNDQVRQIRIKYSVPK